MTMTTTTSSPTFRQRAGEFAMKAMSIPLVWLTLGVGIWAAVIWLGGMILLGILVAISVAVGVAVARGAPTLDRVLAERDLSGSPAGYSLEAQGLAECVKDASGRKDSSGPNM